MDFKDTSAIVMATVLKEFFRTLPESLIVSDQYESLYESLMVAKNNTETDSKVEEIKT